MESEMAYYIITARTAKGDKQYQLSPNKFSPLTSLGVGLQNTGQFSVILT